MIVIRPTPADVAEFAPQRGVVVMGGVPMVVTSRSYPEPADEPSEGSMRLVASVDISSPVVPLVVVEMSGENSVGVEPK